MPITTERVQSILVAARDCYDSYKRLRQAISDSLPTPSAAELIHAMNSIQPEPESIETIAAEATWHKSRRAQNERMKRYQARKRGGLPQIRAAKPADVLRDIDRQRHEHHLAEFGGIDPSSPYGTAAPSPDASTASLIFIDGEPLIVGPETEPMLRGDELFPMETPQGEASPFPDASYAQAKASGYFSDAELREMFPAEPDPIPKGDPNATH